MTQYGSRVWPSLKLLPLEATSWPVETYIHGQDAGICSHVLTLTLRKLALLQAANPKFSKFLATVVCVQYKIWAVAKGTTTVKAMAE